MSKKAAVRKLSDVEASAKIRQIRISPQKLNLVATLIRGMKASEALVQLQFSQKRISKDIKALLESAIANAENNHDLDIDRLYIDRIHVGKSLTMKRFSARARGRGARILKPFSNMEIVVREYEEAN
jgi:large subunit ribosomal protein L22